jgi:maleate isomerase
MKLIENLPFETDQGIAPRGRIGVIVLASDYTIEHEWREIFRHVPGVALYHSRILNDDQITPETLRAMEPRIRDCADVFLPGAKMDVIAYGCTSASMAIGEQRVFERIREARPDVACTTPITAAFAAFDAFKAKRIGVLTPYRADVNQIVADYITARGYEVPVFGSFNEGSDAVVAAISPASVRAGVKRLARMKAASMRYSCRAPRSALQKQPQTSKQKPACRSHPATTPWPGMRCGWRALPTACLNWAVCSACVHEQRDLVDFTTYVDLRGFWGDCAKKSVATFNCNPGELHQTRQNTPGGVHND